MGILSELMLPKGFDAVWGLCTDTITSKIKSTAEQQQINEKLEAYLSRKLKENWFCTREEEIDFEGLANYIRGDLLADVEIRLFGEKQERELARKRILEKAAIYASANTTLSRQRAQKMVSDVVEMLNNFWHTKVPKELRMISGEIVDEVCSHQTEQTERVLSKLDDTKDSMTQKIEEASCLSAESNLLLMKNGQSEEAVKRMTAGLQALSAAHPLFPDYRTGYRTIGTKDELYSIPLSKDALEKYPPKLKLTATATLGGQPVSNINLQNFDYAYRHQVPFLLNVIEAKKYLGDTEDPFQFEAERAKGKQYTLKPPEFPPAFPCSLIGDDKPILEYMLLRTKEILDDGTQIVTNEEQENVPFRITLRIHLPHDLFSFDFQPIEHTNRERLRMMKVVQAMSEATTVRIHLLDVGKELAAGKLPPNTLCSVFNTLSDDIEFWQKIVDVEQYFNIDIHLPKMITPEDINALDYIANLVRGGVSQSSWKEWEFEARINQQIKEMAEHSDRILDMEFGCALSEVVSIELWGHTYKLPLVRVLCSATIKDWERVRKKVEALDIGDPLKLTLIPGKSGNLVEDELDKRYKQN